MAKKNEKFEWKGIDLVALRQVMDKPADEAVESIFESQSMRHLVEILKGMAENDDFVSNELPASMHNFAQAELNFEFTDEDIKFFKQTHEIWKKKGMKFVFILFFRALPYTYMAEKPANVLRMTKLLETHTERRIFETAQFVFDVMDEGWWEPDKQGILTAMKVRIMHAAMRHVILDENKTGEKWNPEWGQPISQEDLVATNQVFSLEFFKGMEMLGDQLSSDEQEAWFHTWKTIGKIMGVQDELISKNVDEAWTLQHKIYDHLFRDKTISGISLAKALVETLEHFHLSNKLVLVMMKHMLADEQFPDCFERMLGPSYESEFPELFETHDTDEKKEKYKKELRGHFHSNLKEYYDTLHEHKSKYRSEESHKGWFQKAVDWFMKLIGVSKEKQQLIDIHLKLIHNVLHHPETGNPVQELEEELMIDAMNSLGGIMIAILSKHFRKGKDSGFRIPKSLKDNWALKG